MVPAIQELRQEDHKLKTRLGYGIQSRASWVAVRPYPPSPKEDSGTALAWRVSITHAQN